MEFTPEPSFAEALVEGLQRIYSRITRELTPAGHFTMLDELGIPSFLSALRHNATYEHLIAFLVDCGSGQRNLLPLKEASFPIVHVLGDIVPKVCSESIFISNCGKGIYLSHHRALATG